MEHTHPLLHLPEPKLAELLRTTPGRPPFPVRSDRAAWEAFAQSPLAPRLLAQAEQALAEPIRPVLASEILAFFRRGEREPSESAQWAQATRLTALTLAECLEGAGRFLDAAQDALWAVCEQSTWLYAAHLGRYREEELPDPEAWDVDLGVALTALDLAEAGYLLGEALHPAVRRRLHYEVERRALAPFLARNDFWWLGPQGEVNNWTAVCVAGVVGAALYLEPDAARLAAIIAKGLGALGHYLATFGPDGGTVEGPGYWGFGFAHYALLSHLLECRSEGALTLFDDPLARRSARYPLRVELSPGRYVPFSDVGAGQRVPDETLAYLGHRLGDADLLALIRRQGTLDTPALDGLAPYLRHMAWLQGLEGVFKPSRSGSHAAGLPTHKLLGQGESPKGSACQEPRARAWEPARLDENDRPKPLPAWQPAERDWIAGQDWLVARYCPAEPGGLVLAVKGGHNDESHNHNDLGQFVVHWREESLVTDLGAARYTRGYFRPEERYAHPAAGSYGHAVPTVDGQGQLAGRERRAEVLRRVANDWEDALTLELRSAYAGELGLESLRRTISLWRIARHGRVVIEDELKAAEPRILESPLITLGTVEALRPGLLRVSGERGALRVRYDPQTVQVRIDLLPAVDLDGGPTDVRRIAFAWRIPKRRGRLKLEIMPEGSVKRRATAYPVMRTA